MKSGQTLRITLAAVLAVVFLLSAPALQAQKFGVLHTFTSGGNGANPAHPGIISQGQDGYMYSTTLAGCGGFNLFGEVFKINPQGKFKVVTCLNSDSTLGSPFSGVTLGTDGKFYGTSYGGDYYGSLWKVTSSGKLTIYKIFGTYPNVFSPFAPPVLGMDGSFYGTANSGGTSGLCTYGYGGCGGIYKVKSTGKGETVLHPLAQTDGANSISPLLLGTDGNFYGTTSSGGLIGGGFYGGGVVFKTTPSGSYTELYAFCKLTSCADGAYPYDGLVQGTDGNFYGTAEYGGTHVGPYSGGVVFRISPTGQYKVLYNFCAQPNCTDGNLPYGGLVQASDGNFYGTTFNGGSHNYGTIFQLTPSGNYTVLYNFDSTTGNAPEATLLQHTNGILYGDTYIGGTSNAGVFFSLDMGLPPFAKLVTWWGKVGSTIGILGQGFTGATSVSFNGTPAAFKATKDTYLTATVPAGATSGYVTVVTPKGTLTSSQVFQVQ